MTDSIQDFNLFLTNWLFNLLTNCGITTSKASLMITLLLSVSLILATVLFCYLLKKLIKVILISISKAFKAKFSGFLVDNRVPHYVSMLVAYLSLVNMMPVILYFHSSILLVVEKLLSIYLVYILLRTIMSIIHAGFDTLREKENYHDRPISSYKQVIQIILVILGIILIASILTGQSPYKFIAAMGAASAVLLLMFKDTIMGFVASVQVTSNDMVRIGDWITMPKYGADGDVIEITLTTVKVQNFDKTITTIPTYALISDSFQNWRGMINTGGRRIKRAIIIKQSSIRFIADNELARFKKIQGISNYIDERQEEIRKHNEAIGADRSVPVNGRNLTNAGLFRKYADWYINNHPGTKKDMILMVRQLAPTEVGIPIELYAFTDTTSWTDYEYIMADIFDHLIASVCYFDLLIYERQSGSDVQRLQMVDSSFNQYSSSLDQQEG